MRSAVCDPGYQGSRKRQRGLGNLMQVKAKRMRKFYTFPAGTQAQCNHLHCGRQCMRKVQDAGEGIASFRRNASAATRAHCDHLLGSNPVIRHPESMDPREGLAALRKDAAAGTRGQCNHLHCRESASKSAGCRRGPCSISLGCGSSVSSGCGDACQV